MAEPMWPDERIMQAFAAVADDDGQITGGDVMLIIQGIRDEMQQRIDELENSWRNRVQEDEEDVGKDME
jgi:hypothetical protein